MTPRLGRRLFGAAMTGATYGAAALAILALGAILAMLVARGAGSLDWNFFTKSSVPLGENGGGFAHAIVGTLLIVGLACAIGVPIGVGGGIFLAEFGGGGLGWLVRFVADTLNGIPSIVIGIFAWTWIVRPAGKFTAFAGGVALACILAPIVARTTEEMVRLVPNSLREAALALGYQRWRTSLQVVVRTASAGIVTGCLVAMARVAGETAPLLFTALGNQFFSTDLFGAMAALPLQIYVYAVGPYDEWHRQAWAGALVLILLVLLLGTFARLVTRARRHA
ncbi:MAG: phosphate ABC transporter, permease protein PstA [Gemmatimonadetes bacterium GWC2_71_9]|nr:MAG: phosphate ABC transporter, permease protein PstA [Gemmatimonadetes bacterium GWC2_71_9]OGT97257.1 MAG: phosphate ABC transporter, permease protein PstA [Gemmatimonadetes bacterium RIFCSPLOWO2_02_FULL_71_11]